MTDSPTTGSAARGAEDRLDDRKAAILRAIVEQYVEHAQPVGSQTVTQTTGLGVSAATVRNEMSVLEREGYITQPHTSAGRIPTDRGYRYFVDHLAGVSQLSPPERRRIAEFFTTATVAMDDLLRQTSLLLARVTTHAAVVVGPQSEAILVRGVSLVRLHPRALVAVIVLSNGSVEKEIVVFDDDLDETDVAAAGARLAQRLEGRRLADLGLGRADGNENDRAEEIARTAYEALRVHVASHHDDPLYVGGASRLAAEQEAFATTSAASVIELLEQHAVLAALLRELLGPGLVVRIGAENEQADLRECSLVLAPYLVEGELAGTVGVLGPTRMDYRKAKAAVSTVSRRLGKQLSG
jgi:heat-inducible transcriptional repressor